MFIGIKKKKWLLPLRVLLARSCFTKLGKKNRLCQYLLKGSRSNYSKLFVRRHESESKEGQRTDNRLLAQRLLTATFPPKATPRALDFVVQEGASEAWGHGGDPKEDR